MGWLSPKTEEQISASARVTPGLPRPAFLHSCLGEGLRKAPLASRTLTSYEEDLRQHNTLLFIRSHRECANWWTSRHVRVPCLYVCTVCPQTCPRCARTGRSRSQGLWERESFSLVLSREGSCEIFKTHHFSQHQSVKE